MGAVGGKTFTCLVFGYLSLSLSLSLSLIFFNLFHHFRPTKIEFSSIFGPSFERLYSFIHESIFYCDRANKKRRKVHHNRTFSRRKRSQGSTALVHLHPIKTVRAL